MTGADVARLPLRKIESALRKTTEGLAMELAAPTGTTPDWTDFEWCIARSAAAMHGVSPLLSSTLRWRGPERWERFLAAQKQHTLQRHQRIARLLADIGARAASDGIAMVALKGAALHEIGIYQPGERPMSDIDLLVRSADRQAATKVLDAFGYHATYVTWKHLVFEPRPPESGVIKSGVIDSEAIESGVLEPGIIEPDATIGATGFGEHARNPIKIELHTRVAERMPIVDRDISALIFPPRPTAGLNSYPSVAALMIHLLTHAAGAMCFNHIRLLHLHDIALLSRRMVSSDWKAVFSAEFGQAAWWISPPLMLTAQYYSGAIPAHIVARAASDCSWLLRQICRRRTLCDVSLSNLWIQAFPGIEWSHSMLETFKYAVSRVKPGQEVLAGRKKTARMHPGVGRFSWSHLPQWQRIARWAWRRPPRVETLSSVCAALADLDPRLTQQP